MVGSSQVPNFLVLDANLQTIEGFYLSSKTPPKNNKPSIFGVAPWLWKPNDFPCSQAAMLAARGVPGMPGGVDFFRGGREGVQLFNETYMMVRNGLKTGI